MNLRDLVSLWRGDIEVNKRSSGALGAGTAVVFRLGQFGHQGHGPGAVAARVVHKIVDLLYVKLLIGSDLPASVHCGPRLRLPHGGRGVFLNGGVVLGSDVTIQQQVTVGNNPPRPGAPKIGDGVSLGVKCSVIGAVTVGDGAKVGAHALVLHDVPADAVAVGVPARSR